MQMNLFGCREANVGAGNSCARWLKRGAHGSSDGNTSIFRGLSRVAAFLQRSGRYLTLKAEFLLALARLSSRVWPCMCK